MHAILENIWIALIGLLHDLNRNGSEIGGGGQVGNEVSRRAVLKRVSLRWRIL